MTDEAARRVANVILGAAAAGAAWYVVRTPRLRAVAWRLGMTALTVTVPGWLASEVQRAWSESDRVRTRAEEPVS